LRSSCGNYVELQGKEKRKKRKGCSGVAQNPWRWVEPRFQPTLHDSGAAGVAVAQEFDREEDWKEGRERARLRGRPGQDRPSLWKETGCTVGGGRVTDIFGRSIMIEQEFSSGTTMLPNKEDDS